MTKFFKTMTSLAAVVALAACGGGDSSTGDASNVPLAQSPALVQQFAAEFNATRAVARVCGTTSVAASAALGSWNPKLQQAAQNHADDMARNNFFSHAGSNGSTTQARLDAVGYKSKSGGEILANGSLSASVLISGWVNSPGHCAVLMAGDFGTFAFAQNGSYSVAMFGD